MAKAATVPDHLQCRRSDGRLWRCSRAAMPNRSFRELHYLQYRQKSNRSKCREKLRSAASKNSSQLELVRMVLKWQIERQNRKKEKVKSEKKIESGGEESMKELPNGVMAIAKSPAPAPLRVGGGGGSWVCERKLGFDSSFLLWRYVRLYLAGRKVQRGNATSAEEEMFMESFSVHYVRKKYIACAA